MKRGWHEDCAGEDSFAAYPGSTLPDRSKSDYYCELCDSHMNSPQMWESHVVGKRHVKNRRKQPGEPPSKIKAVRADVASRLDDLLAKVRVPVVGLDYLTELQKAEVWMDPTYTCYLCHGTFTHSAVVSHLVSTKHRLNFLKEVDKSSFDVIESLKLKKSSSDSLAEGKAHDWEKKFGRGKVEVKVEKAKSSVHPPLPKARNLMDDHIKINKHYIDLDAPSTSTLGRYSPDVPGLSVPEPLMPQPPVVQAPQGISDIDILRDVKMLSTEMKLAILEDMIVKHPRPINTEEDARRVLNSLMMMSKALMQFKVRRLPYELQQKLIEEITHPDINNTYAGRLGFIKKE